MSNAAPASSPSNFCPVCDVCALNASTVEALALGVALGAAFMQHAVTEMMCRNHRTAYIIAAARVIARLEGAR